MATEIEICNSAIAKVRGKRILTLSDDTTEARLLTDMYPRVRDALLRSHPWNFAKARQALAASVDEPVYEYDYKYQLPISCLRLLSTDIPDHEPWALEEERYILTSCSEVNVTFIKLVTADKFDAHFCEVLSYQLAEQLAYPLTQGTALAASMEAKAARIMKECRSFNAQERGSIQQLSANEWLNARY